MAAAAAAAVAAGDGSPRRPAAAAAAAAAATTESATDDAEWEAEETKDAKAAERDRQLLANSREAGYSISKEQKFPEGRTEWLTDASLHRACLYLILPFARREAKAGKWDRNWKLKIQYPTTLELFTKRKRTRFTDRLLEQECVVLEAICVDRKHFIGVVYDTRKAVRSGDSKGRITMWDPLGLPDPVPGAPPHALDRVYASCQAIFGSAMELHVLPERLQSDGYQCAIWDAMFFIEYIGDVTSGVTTPFSMCANTAYHDLTYDPGRASREQNETEIAVARQYLRRLTSEKKQNPRIDCRFGVATDHTDFLFNESPIPAVAAAPAVGAKRRAGDPDGGDPPAKRGRKDRSDCN